MKEQLKMASPGTATSGDVPPSAAILVYDRPNQSAGNSGILVEGGKWLEDLHALTLTVSTKRAP